MRPLWIRFSILISGFFLLLMLLPIGLFLFDDLFSSPQRDSDFALRDVPETAFALTAFVGVVGCGLGVWLSRELSRPIKELSTVAQEIGAGKFGQKVPVPTQSEELYQLATTFNQMSEQLHQAQQSRNQLLADVSHELRTPLTVLSGQLRASLDNVAPLEEEQIAGLYQQTKHLIQLVNDLHLIAKAEAKQLPMKMQEIEMTAFLSQLVEHFRPITVEQSINFSAQIPDSPIHIEGDEIRLRQIFSNLLGNALQHTPAHGQIGLTAEVTKNHLTITITDTGAGIDPEHLPHLFNRFYRTDASRDRQTGGSGLGLAIVQALVHAHNGESAIHSDGLGLGTAVTVHLNHITT